MRCECFDKIEEELKKETGKNSVGYYGGVGYTRFAICDERMEGQPLDPHIYKNRTWIYCPFCNREWP